MRRAARRGGTDTGPGSRTEHGGEGRRRDPRAQRGSNSTRTRSKNVLERTHQATQGNRSQASSTSCRWRGRASSCCCSQKLQPLPRGSTHGPLAQERIRKGHACYSPLWGEERKLPFLAHATLVSSSLCVSALENSTPPPKKTPKDKRAG